MSKLEKEFPTSDNDQVKIEPFKIFKLFFLLILIIGEILVIYYYVFYLPKTKAETKTDQKIASLIK